MDVITDSMDVSLRKLQEMVKDREAGMLQSTGSQRVRHSWVTEQKQHLQHVSVTNHLHCIDNLLPGNCGSVFKARKPRLREWKQLAHIPSMPLGGLYCIKFYIKYCIQFLYCIKLLSDSFKNMRSNIITTFRYNSL